MSEQHTPAAVVNVQPAVNYVTRDVFDATLAPMQSDISEMKGDVKTLLARDASSRAITGLFKHVSTLATTVVAGSIGALIALFVH